MFRHYWKLKEQGKDRIDEIEGIFVTEYYNVKPIDGTAAFYITGSDVYGPMGHELIAFESEDDAKEFMKDHKGKQLLKFEEVTPDILKGIK